MQTIDIVKKLVSFSPRQLKGEDLARDFILEMLKNKKVDFKLQEFKVSIPVCEKYALKADGENIKCLPTSFKSGKIVGKENIISSLVFSFDSEETPNINFNPCCSGISLLNFYFSPSLAIAPRELGKIIKANEVNGFVKVKKIDHFSSNIIIGNLKSPKTVVFAHYDSIGKGAVDNASGVSAVMKAIFSKPKKLKNTLYVFSGAEELSYDRPIYWGCGFRVFEKKYKSVLEKARKIIVVDGVGSGKTNIRRDREMIYLTFPVRNMERWKNKIFVLQGDFDKIKKVIHSEKDDINQVENIYLDDAVNLLVKII